MNYGLFRQLKKKLGDLNGTNSGRQLPDYAMAAAGVAGLSLFLIK
jgi:hypothetical protein